MNIRKAKKLYSNNTYLKEIIFHLKSGNRSKYKLIKGKHHKMKDVSTKIRKSFIKFFNKCITK